MNKLHQQILHDYHWEIVTYLKDIIDKVIDYFHYIKLLNDFQYEKLSNYLPKERARQFNFLLPRLGLKAFPAFIDILQQTKQYKLKQILLQADYEIHKECGLSIPEY